MKALTSSTNLTERIPKNLLIDVTRALIEIGAVEVVSGTTQDRVLRSTIDSISQKNGTIVDVISIKELRKQ